jgi:hypothetical protein
MSNVKLAPTRILKVIPSDYCDIPYPTIAFADQSNSNTTAISDISLQNNDSPFQVQNSSGDWVNIVNPGDVIYFEGANLAATIAEVLSPSVIVLNEPMLVSGDTYTYTIYQNSLFPNQGCQLFIPGKVDAFYTIRITSAGQDSNPDNKGYLIANVQPQLFPLQIVKLWSRDISEGFISYAMW